jgi:hypothetical protein
VNSKLPEVPLADISMNTGNSLDTDWNTMPETSTPNQLLERTMLMN